MKNLFFPLCVNVFHQQTVKLLKTANKNKPQEPPIHSIILTGHQLQRHVITDIFYRRKREIKFFFSTLVHRFEFTSAAKLFRVFASSTRTVILFSEITIKRFLSVV